jgi:hypothetical protein
VPVAGHFAQRPPINDGSAERTNQYWGGVSVPKVYSRECVEVEFCELRHETV